MLAVAVIAVVAGNDRGAPTATAGADEAHGDPLGDETDATADETDATADGSAGNDAVAGRDEASAEQPWSQTPAADDAPADDLGEPVDPGPTSPPVAGTYTYRTVTADGEESLTDLEVVDLDRDEAETIQEIRGTNRGNSDDLTVWTLDRVVTRQTTYRFNGNEGDCNWKPELTHAVVPLEVGSSWSNDSTCTITGLGPVPTMVRRSESVTVLRLERRRISGQVLDLWVIQEEGTTDLSGFTVSGTTTRWFSPRHGLTVRTEAHGSATATESPTSFTSEIQNLHPKT